MKPLFASVKHWLTLSFILGVLTMMHLGAFHEVIDPAGALVPIAAVQDDTVFTSGDDMRVPIDLPFILGVAGLLEATAALRAQVSSPSLRRVSNLDIEPFGTGLAFSDLHAVDIHTDNAVPVRGDEAVNFNINSNPAAATSQYGLIIFGDGAQAPVSGDMISVRGTLALAAVLGEWASSNITFDQDLPIGNYDVVGMRVVEATGVAARLNFVGGAWRPGTPIANSVTEPDAHMLRHGKSGIWGTFHTNTPPTVDVLAAAGAITPVIILDLIARG
jgi:hypothetical protein